MRPRRILLELILLGLCPMTARVLLHAALGGYVEEIHPFAGSARLHDAAGRAAAGPIGSRSNDSVLGLFLHVLDPFLAATLHFLGADIFLVGAQHPLVAKRIEHGAHAVAPELVLGGLYKLGP